MLLVTVVTRASNGGPHEGFTSTYRGVTACLAQCLNSVLNVKAVVGTFNQEKALVGAFSVITNLRMELFEALFHWMATKSLFKDINIYQTFC